jgi:hypothetical protein
MDGKLSIFYLTWAGSPLYSPSATVSMRLGHLDDLHSLNLGIISANVRREEFVVTDHCIDIPEWQKPVENAKRFQFPAANQISTTLANIYC